LALRLLYLLFELCDTTRDVRLEACEGFELILEVAPRVPRTDDAHGGFASDEGTIQTRSTIHWAADLSLYGRFDHSSRRVRRDLVEGKVRGRSCTRHHDCPPGGQLLFKISSFKSIMSQQMLPGFEPRILNGNCCLSNQSDRSNSFPEGDGVLGMRGILEDVTFEICALVQSCRFTADPAHFFTGNPCPSANQIMNQSRMARALARYLHLNERLPPSRDCATCNDIFTCPHSICPLISHFVCSLPLPPILTAQNVPIWNPRKVRLTNFHPCNLILFAAEHFVPGL
jgi:hypothetical protein